MSDKRLQDDSAPGSVAEGFHADISKSGWWRSQSRLRKARIYEGLAFALLIALMVALGLIVAFLAAADARAESDPSPAVVAYVDRYAEAAVCPVLDKHHTVSGMLGVLYALEGEGFSPFEAGQIVGMSVTEFCPRNYRLLTRFTNVYGQAVL